MHKREEFVLYRFGVFCLKDLVAILDSRPELALKPVVYFRRIVSV